MTKRSRRKFSAEFKAKVALEAIKEVKTLQELSTQFEVHPQLIARWKQEFLQGAARVFDGGPVHDDNGREQDIDKLYKKIGQMQIENDFLKKAYEKLK
jgi:transposase